MDAVKKKYGKLIADLKKANYSLTQLSNLHFVSRNTVIKIKKLMAA